MFPSLNPRSNGPGESAVAAGSGLNKDLGQSGDKVVGQADEDLMR